MSRSVDPQLKQRAETLSALLTAEHHPQVASEKLSQTLRELRERSTQERVINFRLPRQNSRTAVHLAASKGLWQCLEILLKNGGDPNALSNHSDLRQTPLHLAAREGNGKCIEVLLENGANYALENDKKKSALDLSTDQSCRMKIENTIMKLEVPKRNRSEEDVVTKLHGFVENRESHLFFQLYTNQPLDKVDLGTRWYDIHVEPENTETLLYRACSSESEQIVEFMLAKSGNQPLPNLRIGQTPLHIASERGNTSIARLLLRHSPKLLLEKDAVSERSALHVACKNGYGGVVEAILEHVSELVRGLQHVYNNDNPFPLDFSDSEDVTPFYLACLHGFAGIVRQFLAIKTNLGNSISLTVNRAQKSGHTPLHAAAYSGNCEVVKLLLPLAEVDAEILAPLTFESKKLLLKSLLKEEPSSTIDNRRNIFVSTSGEFVTDSDILMKGDQPLRLTPLAEACVHSHAEVVEVFLEHGIHDEEGLTCRVLLTLGNFDLCRKVLAYHCKLSKSRGSTGTPDEDDTWNLHLLWSGKKLSLLKREWLGSSVLFTPTVHSDEFDDASYSQRNQRYTQNPTVSLHLPKRIDNTFITNVTLRSNCLKIVPLQLFQLTNVTAIDLSGNQLTALPTDRLKEDRGVCGWECKKLRELNVSENMLTEFPLSLWMLQALRKINAEYNRIKKLAGNTAGFSTLHLTRTLEKVNLFHNDLEEIDALLLEIYSLKTLVLSHNKLTRLPLRLWSIDSLHELKLDNNSITTLAPQEEEDPDMGSYKQPSRENSNPAMAGATRVTGAKVQFRPQVSRFPSLDPQKSIDPDGISSMYRVDYMDGGNEAAGTLDVSRLKKLDLSDNKFEDFPQELPCMAPALEELSISNNPGIKTVEVQFLPMTLKRLQARNCKIEKFGTVLNKEQLKGVKQSCVRKEFHEEACHHRNHTRLVNLTSLHLRNNHLSHFQVLYHMPPSTSIPNFGPKEDTYQSVPISELLYPSLENLDLSHNRLRGKFNPNIAHLTMIKSIQLNDNEQLQVIPYEFGHFKKLTGFTELSLQNLPELVQPPKDVQGHTCLQILTYLAAGLRESEMHRTIKLFLVGKGMRGKSTLLRRLGNQPDKGGGRAVGIDIVKFSYPPAKSPLFGKRKEPVEFLVWDFAGQDQYCNSTHYCFYSQRSLYLAVFRLTDREEGVRELDPWLRNIQLRAPGCPVVIVGTHMDGVNKHDMAHLEEMARKLYINVDHNKTNPYPHVVDVVSVSCRRHHWKENNMEKLKRCLYDISTHLYLVRDGQTLKYAPDMKEDDTKALFRQQVPKSFLTLQEECREYVRHCPDWAEPAVENGVRQRLPNGVGPGCDHEEGLVPVMNEEEFRNHFGGLFNNDREELDEAVSFLHLQGTLLHFDDHNLRDLYILDPQWLAKLMAHVIHPQAVRGNSPVVDGIVQVSHLFWNHDFSDCLKRKYIQLLEKFEVALKISNSQVLIPSLLPNKVTYPQPNDDLREITYYSDEFYMTALRRFWLADFIPEGFWPRLICRIANDQQIEKILRTLIGDTVKPAVLLNSDSFNDGTERESLLDWRPWKMGVAFSHRGRTLLVVKEADNTAPESSGEIEWLPAKKRIEIHVYAHEWFEVQNELQMNGRPATMLQNTFSLPGIATQLLVKISQHILSLAMNWFRGMLDSELIYIPCWKCYGQMTCSVDKTKCDESCQRQSRYFPVSRRDVKFPVYAINHEKCIVIAALNKNLHCPMHGPIKVVQTAPDLIFWDLASLSAYEQDMTSELIINENEVLGKGGFGFVCEGELLLEGGTGKKVAVKGFLSDAAEIQDCSVAELLRISKRQENLYHAYKEIRQEVSFLAVLDHPNLTKLCGVRTSPYMCLLLELAPHGSLGCMLKVYRKYDVVLEPVTLQASILQIASGMEYLHMKQIVHKDMKSANVLVWQFPSGRLSREKRVERAGRVRLKLADYGISQVFTKPIMKLNAEAQKGTPGFMAPELFGPTGQEIATDKVDVFAFGMVIYELLSLQGPFASVEVGKRNTLVKEKKRPQLQGKGLRSLLMAQSIMRMCWSHDPDKRPTMKEITECVGREEFSRLRAEISLEKVESVSCACVYRVTHDSTKENDEGSLPLPNGHCASGIGHIQDSICSAMLGEGFSIMNDMDPCTEYTRLQNGLPSFVAEKNILPPVQDGHGTITTDGPCCDSVDDDERKYREQSHFVKNLGEQAYTQVWVCDRKERGLLEIFTYFDSQAGYYAYACRSHDQITTICPVHDMMWIGTTKGILKLKHAPTLSTKFKGELKTEGRSIEETFVLSIAHVEQTSSVLVSTNAHEIWAFSDKLTNEGLVVEERMRLADGTNCYQMIIVEVLGSLEVWGTMDYSQLVMFKKQGKGWMVDGQYKINVKPESQFFHIAHAAFTDMGGITQDHLWVPYRQKGSIVCWDLQTRKYKTKIDTSVLRSGDGTSESDSLQPHPKVTAIAASGKKVLVGTDIGIVGIIDSETCLIIHILQWHASKVRSLLLMPKQIEPCVCPEIPLPEFHREHSGSGTEHFIRSPSRKIVRQQTLTDSDLISLTDANPCIIHGAERAENNIMVASIGNGRRGLTDAHCSKNDVSLLLWRC